MGLFVFLLMLPLPMPVVLALTNDPAPGVFRSKADARNLDCTRIDRARAHELHPGLVPAPPARGVFLEADALECETRVMEYGDRPARDEAMLTQLSQTASDVAEAANALGPEGVTWLVDAFYPDSAIASKISFATKNALVNRGRRVSDRLPILAAGDIMVLGEMAPEKAYPLACARYRAEGSMKDDEALLAVFLIDSRETILHAGFCTRGGWRWLR